MFVYKLKKIIYLSIFIIPILAGNLSCANKDQSFESFDSENIEDYSSIKGVAALGQLSPSGEVRKLASPSTRFGIFPRVIELLVKEGDYVKEGSVLAVFENKEKLEAELEMKNNLIIKNDLEISLKKEQIEMYEQAAKNEAYSLVSLSQRKDELLKLEKQKLSNLLDKKNIEIDLYNTELRSPIDGYILSINTREGERSDGDGILEIGVSQNMEALIEVYESDIDRVFLSQEVELTSENGGFRDKLYGKVIRISPQVKQRKVLSTDPTGDADARIIEVLVMLDQKSIELVEKFAGMKVIAIFIPK